MSRRCHSPGYHHPGVITQVSSPRCHHLHIIGILYVYKKMGEGHFHFCLFFFLETSTIYTLICLYPPHAKYTLAIFVNLILWDFGIIHIFSCLGSHAGVIALRDANTSAHIFFRFLQALLEPGRCGGGGVLEHTQLSFSLSLATWRGGGLQ